MRRKFVAALAAITLAGAAAAPAIAPSHAGQAVMAKPCSSGWKHAVIGGEHKCLRRGQFCARRYDSQYHRYGYHCHKRDSRGNYHLT
jgi:hypothetical protein